MVESPRSESDLERYLRDRLERRSLLLMTHVVMGYPSFEDSFRLVEAMVEGGVELMELQIPFSEPIADGPVILRANQVALTSGATVDACFAFADRVAHLFDIPFLFMSYYNILFRRGVLPFAERTRGAGLRGAIVPDLPPEEAAEYLGAMSANDLDPIFIYAPNTPPARLEEIGRHGRGFVYCVARKGVTGASTQFSSELSAYLMRARAATTLPLAVGFGVKDREDVEFLRGKADIAVVGSETIRAFASGGVDGVRELIRGLRPE